MAITPEKFKADDQLLLDRDTNQIVGIRSGRGTGDLLPMIPYVQSATFNPPLISAGTQSATVVSMPVAVMGDLVAATFSLDLQGITLSAYVNVAGSVTVVFRNGTAGDIDIASGTLNIILQRIPT